MLINPIRRIEMELHHGFIGPLEEEATNIEVDRCVDPQPFRFIGY